MFKKILAVAMATAMVFSVAQVAPANTTVADAAAQTITKATVGAEDLTQGFWTDFSDDWKLEDKKKMTIEFEHHSNFTNAWDVYALILTNSPADAKKAQADRPASYLEYIVNRADLWSWSSTSAMGTNTGAVDGSAAGQQASLDGSSVVYTNDFALDWTKFQDVMKDANVKMVLERSGNTVKVTVDAASTSDATNKINYTVTTSVAKDATTTELSDVNVMFTCEKACLKFKSVDISDITGNLVIEKPPVAEVPATKKTLTLLDSSATTSKVTGELTVAPGKVTVKAGTKTFTGTIKGKEFTVKLSGVKAGAKVTLVIEKDGYITLTKTLTAKGTMKLSKVKTKKNSKKITGTVSQTKATVKVKVGKKKYKKAKVSGKKFTFKCAKLKKGTTVKIQVTKKNYKTLTKSYKVK